MKRAPYTLVVFMAACSPATEAPSAPVTIDGSSNCVATSVTDGTCDGIDDDCDGAIDEDYSEVQTTCGVGACASTGTTSCAAGEVVDSCSPEIASGSVDASCDGTDDDCDGATDEDYVLVPIVCGHGACASTGVTSCVSGVEQDDCTQGVAAADDATCDGVDDDCDGETDEDYAAAATSCGQGACASTGVTSCVSGVEQDDCTQGVAAADDATCDGVDDDCDGETDEDYAAASTSCGQGACASTGVTSCVSGVEQDDCTQGVAAADDATCDGVDDDCNGETDEDYAAASTSCGQGACASTGVTSCVSGVEQDDCTQGVAAADDATCDGVDDDCDGQTDEDLGANGWGCPELIEPGDLVATSPYGMRVDLTWTDLSSYEDGYEVWRSCEVDEGANLDGFCLIATLPPDTQSHRDSRALEGSLLTYRVSAVAMGDEKSATTTVETAPRIDTPMRPSPQGAWLLGDGEPLVLPTSVIIRSNVDAASLRILLRDGDPHSFQGRLGAGGYGVQWVGGWAGTFECTPTVETCDEVDNDCDGLIDENDVCIGAYLPIQAGVFSMGSPLSEDCRSDEETAHEVTLTHDFVMKQTEVTQAQWEHAFGLNQSYFSEWGPGADCGGTCPVENMTTWDALEYCNRLSIAEGLDPCYNLVICAGQGFGMGATCLLAIVDDDGGGGVVQACEGYRLPTEAEWEYAARAGTTGATPAGNIAPEDCDGTSDVIHGVAWYNGNTPVAGPQPVAAKAQNPWGLYDMLGNVAEWTWDGSDASAYGTVAVTDPIGAPGFGDAARLIRGGDWGASPGLLRSASRQTLSADARSSAVGLRPVRTIPDAAAYVAKPAVEVPGLLEVRFHLIGGEPVDDLPAGLVTFEAIGDEGYVIIAEPTADGVGVVVSAATPVGLYRGGMALLSLLLTPDLSARRETIEHHIALSYPDHEIRGPYDAIENLTISTQDPTTISAMTLERLDQLARAGATHHFFHWTHTPMNPALWDATFREPYRSYRDAAADRFVELIVDVGGGGPSQSVTPWGYAFVDGLAIHEEPFGLQEGADGIWRATEEIVVPQVINDPGMSDPTAWLAGACPGQPSHWTYDSEVGHDAPGSWRLDGDGAGTCSTLEQYPDPSDMVDGRYLLTVWVRNDSDGLYGGDYSDSWGQLSLSLTFQDGQVLEGIAITPDIAEAKPANSDGSDWFELKDTFVIDGVAAGNPVVGVRLWARSMAGVGTYWMDDLTLDRIDGALRNIAGGVHPPVVTSSDGQTTYVEGVDYEVCQVGEDNGVTTEICTPPPGSGLGAPQYETVYWPNNPGGTLFGGLEARYSRRLTPFEIRWLPGGSWPADSQVLVSYDIELPYQFQNGTTGGSHASQRYNYCSFDAVFDGLDWGAAFDRIMGGGADELGLDHLYFNVTEVRGVNRSVGCFDKVMVDGVWQWQAKRSNAALFAAVPNRLIAEAKARNPGATIFMHDDMYNPFTNGGSDGYQARYGGVPGRTTCALGPALQPTLCEGVDDVIEPLDPDVVMVPWGYKPDGLRKLVASGRFYDSLERPWLSGPGGVEITLNDWAAAAHSSNYVRGASNFFFYGEILPQSIHTYWNYDWALRYLVDFETPESAYFSLDGPAFTTSTGAAAHDVTGACAHQGSRYKGGLCVTSTTGAGGTVAVVPAVARRRYRAGLHARRADNQAEAAPRARLRWDRGALGEQLGEWQDMVLTASISDGFARFETDPDGVVAPVGTIGVGLEVALDAAGTFEALDDVLLWESVPPCFDDCSVAP